METVAVKTAVVQAWPQTITELAIDAAASGWDRASMDRLWRSYDFATSLFSARLRGSGRPFLCHLAGTAALALQYGGSRDEVLAALLHAAYEQGDFGDGQRGVTPPRRAEMVKVLGEEAEALVQGFDATGLEQRVAELASTPADTLTAQERSALFLRAVNALDDSLDTPVYPPERAEETLAELERAAQGAKYLGCTTLAADIDERLQALAAMPASPASATRSGGSFTRLPRSAMRKEDAGLLRRVKRILRRLLAAKR